MTLLRLYADYFLEKLIRDLKMFLLNTKICSRASEDHLTEWYLVLQLHLLRSSRPRDGVAGDEDSCQAPSPHHQYCPGLQHREPHQQLVGQRVVPVGVIHVPVSGSCLLFSIERTRKG